VESSPHKNAAECSAVMQQKVRRKAADMIIRRTTLNTIVRPRWVGACRNAFELVCIGGY